jgi:hypothetical protein
MGRFVKTYTGSSGVTQYTGLFAGDGSHICGVAGAWEPINVCCNWSTCIASGSIQYNYNFSCWDMIKFVIHSATSSSVQYNYTCVFFGHASCPLNCSCAYLNMYSVASTAAFCYISCINIGSQAYVGNGSIPYRLEICVWPGGGSNANAGGINAEQRSFNNSCSYSSPTVAYVASNAAVYYAKCVNASSAYNAFQYFTYGSNGGIQPYMGNNDAYFGLYGMKKHVGPTCSFNCT